MRYICGVATHSRCARIESYQSIVYSVDQRPDLGWNVFCRHLPERAQVEASHLLRQPTQWIEASPYAVPGRDRGYSARSQNERSYEGDVVQHLKEDIGTVKIKSRGCDIERSIGRGSQLERASNLSPG